MYRVRKLKIEDAQCEALALAAGDLYSRTVTSFWRVVRKKGELAEAFIYGAKDNQKMYRWLLGKVRWMISCKCQCGFRYHRDGVGPWNIRARYPGNSGSPAVGAMASPIGVRCAL